MINVIPDNDEREHERSADCWCEPTVAWQDPKTGEIWDDGPIITHNAADCREAVEKLLGEYLAPDKRWRAYVN